MEVDWVKARAECSLPKVFLRLTTGAKSDVTVRGEIAKANGEKVTFEASCEGKSLLVTRTESALVVKVEFALKQDAIVVQGNKVDFKAVAGLNTIGDCTLEVEGVELALWQVRRKALEKLLFDTITSLL